MDNNYGTIEDYNDHDEDDVLALDDETNLEVHEGDDAGGAGPVGLPCRRHPGQPHTGQAAIHWHIIHNIAHNYQH